MDSLAQSERFRAATLFAARICFGAATQHECEFMRDYIAMDLDGCEIPEPIMTRPNPNFRKEPHDTAER